MENRHQSVPHLPQGARIWLAANVWWMAIIGLIWSIFTLIQVFWAVFSIYGSILVLNTLASVVLLAMAVSPLKARKKRGWSLLFLNYLIGFLYSIFTFIYRIFITNNLNTPNDILTIIIIGNLFVILLTAAVGGYLLYEIRDKFISLENKS